VVGLLSSVLAAWLLAAFSVLQLPWALVAGLSLLAVIQTSLLVIRRTQPVPWPLQTVGVIRVHASDKINAETAVGGATHSILFWGISAKRTASSPLVRAAIIRVAKAGGEVRFLLLDPNSAFLQQRAGEEGESPEAWRSDIAATIQRLKEFAAREGIAIGIRIADEMPVWRILIIDRLVLYVNYFLPSLQGSQSPQLEVAVIEHGLAWPLLRQFEACWRRAKDAT